MVDPKKSLRALTRQAAQKVKCTKCKQEKCKGLLTLVFPWHRELFCVPLQGLPHRVAQWHSTTPICNVNCLYRAYSCYLWTATHVYCNLQDGCQRQSCMVYGVVRSIITQPLLYPPCYNFCGINLVLLTACILTTNLQIAIAMISGG